MSSCHVERAFRAKHVNVKLGCTFMQRILSTYLFVSKKLNRELLALIHGAGFQGVEIFATRSHFDYVTREEVREIAQALADNQLQLASLHAPTSRDVSVNREGGIPLSV